MKLCLHLLWYALIVLFVIALIVFGRPKDDGLKKRKEKIR